MHLISTLCLLYFHCLTSVSGLLAYWLHASGSNNIMDLASVDSLNAFPKLVVRFYYVHQCLYNHTCFLWVNKLDKFFSMVIILSYLINSEKYKLRETVSLCKAGWVSSMSNGLFSGFFLFFSVKLLLVKKCSYHWTFILCCFADLLSNLLILLLSLDNVVTKTIFSSIKYLSR